MTATDFPAPTATSVRVDVDDVARFWNAVDATAGVDAAARARPFTVHYLQPGSPALRAWAPSRVGGPGGRLPDAARALATATASRRRFYAAARAVTLAMSGRGGAAIRAATALRAIEALFPGARVPDVVLVVGRLASAGTALGGTVVIAAEMFARGPETPVDELSPWERSALGTPDDLSWIVAHEAVHCQQPPCSRSAPLLDHVLREGAADFIASLVATPSAVARARHAWGDVREAALWDEFRRALPAGSPDRWLFQGQDAGCPADLGYYLGYRICQAYYRRAADPVVAIRRILTHTDAQALLRDSGYDGAGPPGMEVCRATEPTPCVAR